MSNGPPPGWPYYLHTDWGQLSPLPSPRTMLVNMPLPSMGVTIAVLDTQGNVTINVDQPLPEKT